MLERLQMSTLYVKENYMPRVLHKLLGCLVSLESLFPPNEKKVKEMFAASNFHRIHIHLMFASHKTISSTVSKYLKHRLRRYDWQLGFTVPPSRMVQKSSDLRWSPCDLGEWPKAICPTKLTPLQHTQQNATSIQHHPVMNHQRSAEEQWNDQRPLPLPATSNIRKFQQRLRGIQHCHTEKDKLYLLSLGEPNWLQVPASCWNTGYRDWVDWYVPFAGDGTVNMKHLESARFSSLTGNMAQVASICSRGPNQLSNAEKVMTDWPETWKEHLAFSSVPTRTHVGVDLATELGNEWDAATVWKGSRALVDPQPIRVVPTSISVVLSY